MCPADAYTLVMWPSAIRKRAECFLTEHAWWEADNYFDWMVEPIAKGAGDSSRNSSDTGNK